MKINNFAIFRVFLQRSFWIFLLIVFPLTLDPNAILGGVAEIDRRVLMPKALVLCITWLVGLAAVLATYPNARLLPNRKVLKQIPVSFYFLSLALLAILVSALTTPYASVGVNLIGSRLRVDGALIQIMWYSLAFIGAALMTRPCFSAQQFMTLIAASSSVIALWVLLQGLGIEPLVLFGADWRNLNAVPTGPLANSGLAGGYLAILLMILLLWSVQLEHVPRGFLFPLVITCMGLVISENRAGILAIIVLWPITAVYYMITHRRIVNVIGISFLLILSGSLVWLFHPQPDRLQVNQTRLALAGNDEDTNIRLVYWSIAWEMLSQPLWLGLGPQGFQEGLWRYASEPQQQRLIRDGLPDGASVIQFTGTRNILIQLPEHPEVVAFQAADDKAHNYLLDFGISAGLLGLGAFLLSYGFAVWRMWSSQQAIARAIAAGMVAYGIYGLTWFASIVIDPVMSGLLGAGVGWTLRTEPD